MKLEGQVAIVTGGAQGIGRSIALTFAREGADIIIYDIDSELAINVSNEINALGRQSLAIKCDVSNSKDVSQATKQVMDNFKNIDILVNNAGIGAPSPFEKISEDEWDKTINVNLKGVFLCSQAIGIQMIKQKYGKIINMTSTQAHVAAPLMAAYAASKGGILALTRVLAVEWANYNIKVNAVSPSLTNTPRVERISGELSNYYRDRVKRVPSRRLNEPEDVANTVLFLASPDSDNIIGQAIIVDGGICALHSSYLWPDE